MEAGIHSMPAEQYFASQAVSNSDLKWITTPYTPAHFRAYKDGEIAKKETDAMRIGTITHRCILEPETMAGAFVVAPAGIDYRTKVGKEWRDSQDAPIISQEAADMIARMVRSVWAHPEAKAIISGSERERSLFVEDGPIWLKGRLDCLTKSGNIIADLKTCELADLESVEKAIFDYGYFRQAAYYLNLADKLGIKKDRFVFIFVEKVPPHCVALYSISSDALELGRSEIEASLTTLKFCVQNDIWPGREPGINDAGIPNWAMKRLGALI